MHLTTFKTTAAVYWVLRPICRPLQLWRICVRLGGPVLDAQAVSTSQIAAARLPVQSWLLAAADEGPGTANSCRPPEGLVQVCQRTAYQQLAHKFYHDIG